MLLQPKVLRAGLEVAAKSRPLIYAATKDNWQEVAKLADEFKVPVTLSVPFDLDGLKSMAATFAGMGLKDLILDPGTAPNGKKLQETLLNFIKLRRLQWRRLRGISPIQSWHCPSTPG